jgi:DHA1 family tetracycline resistance protein-like MFS transporter
MTTKAKVFVLGTIFLNALGVGLLIPVVPRLVQSLTGYGPEASSLEVGVLLSVFSATTFFLSPLIGRLSDRFGRRPVLLLSTVGTMIDYALCAIAPTYTILLVARIVAGAFGGSTSVASAALADITPPDQRSRTFGLSSAITGMGMIAGPALGGSLMELGIRTPFYVACALALGELLFGLFWFPETLKSKSQRALTLSDLNPLSSIGRLGSLPMATHILIAVTLYMLGGTIANSVLVLFVQSKMGWNGVQVGILMTTLACTSVAIRYGGVRAALKVFGENGAMLAGFCLFSGGLLALGYVDTGLGIYLALIVGQSGNISQPISMGMLSRSIPPEMQGEAQGAILSVFSLTNMAAPLVGAFAFGDIGIHQKLFGGEFVFVLSGLIVALAFLPLGWGYLSRNRSAAQPTIAKQAVPEPD